MTDPSPDLAPLGFRLNFFKLVVRDLDAMVAFYRRAFGFEIRNRIDLAGLQEVMLALPEDRFMLVLYHHTDGREIAIGNAYGPVGFVTRDVDAAMAHAVASGATPGRGPIDMPGMRIGFVDDPEGHEIEMVQIVRPEAAPRSEA